MPYYLSSMVPVARGRSPFGADQFAREDRNWIVFDRDRALLWLRDSIPENKRLVKIAEHKLEATTSAASRVVGKFADCEFDQPTVQRSVADMLLRPTRWRPLVAAKKKQRFEILLGPDPEKLFWLRPTFVGPNTKTYVDNFNRSNEWLSLTATSSDGLFTWAMTGDGGARLYVESNQCGVTAGNWNIAWNVGYTNADTDTANMYAQNTLTSFARSTATLGTGLGVRGSNFAGSSSGYAGEIGIGNDSSPYCVLYNYANDDLLDSDSSNHTTGLPKTLRIEADGSSIRFLIGGAEILSATNSAHTGGGGSRRAAIMAYSNDNANTFLVDDFTYGDLVEEGEDPTYARGLMLLGVGT